MSSRLVAETTISQGRAAQNARVETGPDVFRQRQADKQNEQRLASMRELPRHEMNRVNRDQIERIGPPPPTINQPVGTENGVNSPRGTGPVGQLIDAWV